MRVIKCYKMLPYVHSLWHSTGIGQTDRQTDKIAKTISRYAFIACWCATNSTSVIQCNISLASLKNDSLLSRLLELTICCIKTKSTRTIKIYGPKRRRLGEARGGPCTVLFLSLSPVLWSTIQHATIGWQHCKGNKKLSWCWQRARRV